MPIRAKLYSMMAEELGSLNDSGGSTVGSLARTSQIITWGGKCVCGKCVCGGGVCVSAHMCAFTCVGQRSSMDVVP